MRIPFLWLFPRLASSVFQAQQPTAEVAAALWATNSTLDPQFVKQADFKASGLPPQVSRSRNLWFKCGRLMSRHISSSAEHPQSKHLAVVFFFEEEEEQQINRFAQRCRWSSVCMQQGHTRVWHVTGRPSGACSSSCLGWIVRDESGDLWLGPSLMMKPSLCSGNYLTVLLSAVFISSHNYDITHCVVQPQPLLWYSWRHDAIGTRDLKSTCKDLS